MAHAQLTLLRHGKSVWNEENRFTGWADVPLAETGIKEAQAAAAACLANGITFDFTCTSYLRRAIQTLWVVLDTMDLMWLPQQTDWRFNERHYGALQGQNKATATAQYGDEQVHTWRRSYATLPPLLTTPQTPPDARYAKITMPTGESLADVVPRVSTAFDEHIVPLLRQQQRVLLVAHGNALRALIKRLENIGDEDIMQQEISTGKPLLYELDETLTPVSKRWIKSAGE